jgi:hypothetical protein
MKRTYNSGIAEDTIFFVGTEIERTPAYGMKTLFVVGVLHSIGTILEKAEKNECRHIYFGANQSFPKLEINDSVAWRYWEIMIEACLGTLMQGRLYERDIYAEKFITAADAAKPRSALFKRV